MMPEGVLSEWQKKIRKLEVLSMLHYFAIKNFLYVYLVS